DGGLSCLLPGHLTFTQRIGRYWCWPSNTTSGPQLGTTSARPRWRCLTNKTGSNREKRPHSLTLRPTDQPQTGRNRNSTTCGDVTMQARRLAAAYPPPGWAPQVFASVEHLIVEPRSSRCYDGCL